MSPDWNLFSDGAETTIVVDVPPSAYALVSAIQSPLSKSLVYVNVLQDGKFYRWSAPL